MRKIFNLILGFSFLALLTVSCEVERFPHNAIEQTQAFNTVADAQALANGMYAQLRGRIYGENMYATDVQADLYNATVEFGNRNGFPHRWDFQASDYTLRDVYYSYYSALTNVNNIIENIHRVETNNDQEVATVESILGEAYLIRAFYYHQLIQRWGNPYNASTAGIDLGVALVTTYDPTGKPARASVQEVYTQILSDIAQAEARLTGGSVAANRVTGDAVLALKARVNLHMGNWNVAAQAAQELINTGRYTLVNNEVSMINMWHNDQGSEIIFNLDATQNELPAGRNDIFLGYIPSQNVYRPDFIPQQWVIDLFEDNDIRKSVYFANLPVRMMNITYNDLYVMNKYPGNPALRPGANTNYAHKPIVFRVAEAYLNLAEAQFRAGNEGDALATLNQLRQARGIAQLSGVAGDELFNEIKDERTRELFGEGYRLNDLMRWGEGFSRGEVQNLDIIETGPNYNELVIEASNPKFIWGIPQNDITINENMVQNPGW